MSVLVVLISDKGKGERRGYTKGYAIVEKGGRENGYEGKRGDGKWIE